MVDPTANEPGLPDAHNGDPHWLELLSAGLTFDLQGLTPSGGMKLPKIEYSFDFEDIPAAVGMEALRLVPGSHLSGGERSMPVMRALFGLARDLMQHFEEAEAAVWPPSRSLIGRRFFDSTVTAWLEGGAFPALGLTAFRETDDGGLESVGLDFLIGQELLLDHSLVGDKVAATRLGIRLINQFVIMGGIREAEYVTSPDGRRLLVSPSTDGTTIRVRGE